MSSQEALQPKKGNNSDFAAQSPKNDDVKSVDEMLVNVDQFIESVYRDLNMSPPGRLGSSTNWRRSLNTSETCSSSSKTPPSPATLPITKPKKDETPVCSPVALCNMDAEIERINRICDNVDENLRSIGVFINSSSPERPAERLSDANLANDVDENLGSIGVFANSPSPDRLIESLSNANLANSPSASTPITTVSTVSSTPFLSFIRDTREQSRTSAETAVEPVIDLSNSQAEPWLPVRRHNDDDDDDVIIVSANIPDVVDLCSPCWNQQIDRPRHTINEKHLNRRRIHRNTDVHNAVRSSEEPPSSRKRRSESSSTLSEHSSMLLDQSTSAINGTPFMCPVCMESCLRRHPTSTVCGHVFCKLCIEQAIAITRKCPMCNKKISKKQTFRIYF